MSEGGENHYHKPPLVRAGLALTAGVVAAVLFCALSFHGDLKRTVPITVVADRAGLVMEPGAKVKLNGVVIGHVRDVAQGDGRARLNLDIDAGRFALLSADTRAEIKATTAFGSKYVALQASSDADQGRLRPGAQVRSANVTTEVNTVFQNLESVMRHVDPAKLNAALSAVADGLRGRGEQLGETLVKTDSTLAQLHPVMPQLQQDLHDAATVTNIYADAAPRLLDMLGYASTTADSVVAQQTELVSMLQAAVTFGKTGAGLTDDLERGLVDSMRLLVPTAGLLAKYSPELTCLLHQTVDTNDVLSHSFGGNTGYSLDLDIGLLGGADPYRYPENLPKVAASGGPGGAPGCYPTITRSMYPSPVLVTDTGANIVDATAPRLASPYFVDYLFGHILGGPAGR
ncbi:MCE family protein [Nocardia sp. NPDC004860]|uniref:MCE family protein n=1 Tax=Nocardia sp. NPDC004860 TaxID=3154557 RepID=UPI0033B351BE